MAKGAAIVRRECTFPIPFNHCAWSSLQSIGFLEPPKKDVKNGNALGISLTRDDNVSSVPEIVEIHFVVPF